MKSDPNIERDIITLGGFFPLPLLRGNDNSFEEVSILGKILPVDPFMQFDFIYDALRNKPVASNVDLGLLGREFLAFLHFQGLITFGEPQSLDVLLSPKAQLLLLDFDLGSLALAHLLNAHP